LIPDFDGAFLSHESKHAQFAPGEAGVWDNAARRAAFVVKLAVAEGLDDKIQVQNDYPFSAYEAAVTLTRNGISGLSNESVARGRRGFGGAFSRPASGRRGGGSRTGLTTQSRIAI
jgi:hypothetical protein